MREVTCQYFVFIFRKTEFSFVASDHMTATSACSSGGEKYEILTLDGCNYVNNICVNGLFVKRDGSNDGEF